jgi:predicted AlkP superfamily phosphohydrolase/phosphomutase
MERRHLIGLVAVAIMVAAAIYLTYSGADMARSSRYKRVIVIGVDGMDPRITKMLMDEGRLPNLQMLAKNGSFMRLQTSYPPNSPVAWTSIATGSNPGKHGIFDFIRREPRTYMPQLSLTKSNGGLSGTYYESYISADPFWRLTTNAGIPTTVIRWPVTFPPEAVKGSMLSGLGVPDIKGFLSGYTYYTSRPGDKTEKSSNRVVVVDGKASEIVTQIWGPKTSKGNEIVDVTAPMSIKVSSGDKSARLTVNGLGYDAIEGQWSGWIRAKFEAGMFRPVYGTFKAYVVSTDPFCMYVTAMQIDPENPVVGISKPDGYSADLATQVGDYYTLGMPEETDGYIDGRLDKNAFMYQIADIEGERDRMFWKEFKSFMSGKGGVFAFVYDSSDRVSHVMWNWNALAGGNLTVSDEIVGYYEGKDRFFGQVLDGIDKETLLLVISDHGFSSFQKGFSMNRWLVDNGFMSLKSEPPQGDDGALFQYVDWSKTKAYSLGFNSIYVNLRGREGKGIVDAKDKENTAGEIIQKLQDYKDAEGKSPVYRAYKSSDIYSGDHVGDGPDVIVGFYPGYRMSWQTAIGGLSPQVIVDNTKKWRGDHLVDPSFVPGVLFSNARLGREEASQMDVAPTILEALGMSRPDSMDGKDLLTGT